MRQIVRILLIAAVVFTVLPTQQMEATNDGDYHRRWYDSSLYEVGWWREDCDHNESSDGMQDGVWRDETVYSCATYGYYYMAWHNHGGAWHLVRWPGDLAYCP